MKKKKVFLIIASIVIIVFVCVVFFIVKDHRENLKINEINQLEVYSAMGKDSSIFHIRYPYKFYTIDGYEGRCRSYDLQNSILREEISEEEFKYFVEYVTNLEKEYPTEDAVVAYRINFIYYDEKGEEHQEVIIGYDDFPEDWGTFIEHVNTICGYNYLSTTGDIVKLTPDSSAYSLQSSTRLSSGHNSFGAIIAKFTPTFAHPIIRLFAMLLRPSPRYTKFKPSRYPKCSFIVKRSARICVG